MSQFSFDVVCLSLKIGGSFSTPPKLTLPIHWRSGLVRQGLFQKIIFLTQRLILQADLRVSSLNTSFVSIAYEIIRLERVDSWSIRRQII